ncbi:MAG TPA: MlaD family protein [Thermoanaerobaculia bacterium]|jgi:phospholipid/cholesterol/gamma-HCH transport system substrate-binding protein|nr:MlaD family protein [Thermoanaerobaculia bacterium]
MTSAAKVGIVMLIALAVLGYFVLRIEDISLSRSRTTRVVKAVFEDVAGLDDESAVRIAGVRKGHVTDIKVLPDGRAEVTLQVDDDVPLHANAQAKVANLGLLGEKYIELDPGSANAPVLPSNTVVMLPGTQPATFDDVTDQVAAIAADVKAITTSMRAVMGGTTGQQRLEEIVENVRGITADVRLLIAANRENVDATLLNTREITAHLRTEIPRLAATLDRVANQIGGTVDENRPDVREVVTNLRGLSADLRVTADNLNAITGQVKSGEGTMGKLFYSDEAHDRLTGALASVEGGVKSLQETLGRANRIQMDLGIKADYYAGLSDSEVDGVKMVEGSARSAIGLRLVPNPDRNRFYNIELADDPRGRKREKTQIETRTNPATGESTTIVTETTKYDRDFLLSAQAGWVLDDLSVRVGLFDSTGGVGADYRFSDRLSVTGEAFDFGKKRDDLPHLRLLGEYVFRHEKPHTPQLFINSGIDNALNDTSFVFGGGIRWRDEDLKYLIGSIPLGK